MTDQKSRRQFFRRKKKPEPKKGNYAFIDSQNLNLGVQRVGWKMDWKKFRELLRDKYDVEKAFMFIGYLPENEDLYKKMFDLGYLVALKPTLEMYYSEEELKKEDRPPTKGNVDAELVMYVMEEMPNYDKAIIVSGDGDFYSLIELLKQKGKLHSVMPPNWRYSTLLKPFEDQIVRIDTMKKELAYRTFSRPRRNNKSSSTGSRTNNRTRTPSKKTS